LLVAYAGNAKTHVKQIYWSHVLGAGSFYMNLTIYRSGLNMIINLVKTKEIIFLIIL